MKRLLCTAICAALLTPVHALAQPADTDLVCDGVHGTADPDGPLTHTPFHDRIRISYSTGKWCREKCQRALPIHANDAARVLLGEEFASPGKPVRHTIYVDHASGELYELTVTEFFTAFATATCRVQPFSGFSPNDRY